MAINRDVGRITDFVMGDKMENKCLTINYKKMKTNYLMIALLSMGLLQLTACGEASDEIIENEVEVVADAQGESSEINSFIDQLPMGELTDAEISGVIFMREEEKLARDVYLTLYDKWSLLPFKNISKSEQVHMDAVLNLLNRYGLEDPAEGNDIGEFTDAHLQELYDELIERGLQSKVEALKVGALIEEVDIEDLQRLLDNDIKSQDVQFVLSNLKRGSTHHLKAYVNVLKRYNFNYVPDILDIEEFNEIVS